MPTVVNIVSEIAAFAACSMACCLNVEWILGNSPIQKKSQDFAALVYALDPLSS